MSIKRIFIHCFCALAVSAVGAQNLIPYQNVIGTHGSTGASMPYFDNDGNYYLFKTIYIPTTNTDMGNVSATVYGTFFFVLSKYTQSHQLLWTESYGGDLSDNLGGLEMVDDGFILVCRSNSPISGTKTVEGNSFFHLWVLKIDFEGNSVWQKTIVVDGNVQFPVTKQMMNGNILISTTAGTGISGDKTDEGYGNSDAWLIMVDQDGEILWDKAIGTEGWDGTFNIIGQLSSGNIVLSAFSNENASGLKTENSYGQEDLWLVCINPENGEFIWDKTVGGSDSEITGGGVIFNNNIFHNLGSYSDISGLRTVPRKGVRDNWVIRFDENGNILNQFSIGGSGNELNGRFLNIQENELFIGMTSSSSISIDKSENSRGGLDIWLVKTDFNGNILTQKTIGGDEDDFPNNYAALPSGNLLMPALSNSGISGEKTIPRIGPNSSDVWVLEIDAVTLNVVNEHLISNQTTLYPNPTSSQINITFSEATQLNKAVLYDLTGKIILTQSFENNFEQSYTLNVSGLASGVYTLSLESVGGVITRQVVVE